jgi:hypothetical protein
MKLQNVVLATLAAGLISTTAAWAVPTATVDGITIPIDSTGGGTGAVFQVQIDHESLIANVGDQLSGVGIVTSISDAPSSTVTFNGQTCVTVGCSGTFLTDVFSGLTVRAITSTTGGFNVFLTGGTLTYYVQHTLPNLNTGSTATDMANATSSTVFLSLAPAVFDSFGDTMEIFVPGNNLAQFSGTAQGNAFLNVTGGDAAKLFDTNTFPTGFNGGMADLSFVGNAARITGNDFPVSGSDDLYANTVPEPASLAILGVGLFIVGWSLRRRSQRSFV